MVAMMLTMSRAVRVRASLGVSLAKRRQRGRERVAHFLMPIRKEKVAKARTVPKVPRVPKVEKVPLR
jgi:hypothetical protein